MVMMMMTVKMVSITRDGGMNVAVLEGEKKKRNDQECGEIKRVMKKDKWTERGDAVTGSAAVMRLMGWTLLEWNDRPDLEIISRARAETKTRTNTWTGRFLSASDLGVSSWR